MTIHREDHDTCQICHSSKPLGQLLPASMVRGSVLQMIKKDHPNWDIRGRICFDCLNQYRARYVQQLMENDLGELDLAMPQFEGAGKKSSAVSSSKLEQSALRDALRNQVFTLVRNRCSYSPEYA